MGAFLAMLANKDLLKLAERYQLKTCVEERGENLCRGALLEVNDELMVSFTTNVRSSIGQEYCYSTLALQECLEL